MTGRELVGWVSALIIILVLFGLTFALGHEAETGWRYPAECCGDGDCVMVHDVASRVRTVDGGYLIDGHYFVAHSDTRLSPDGKWHVCIFNGKLYCVFRPFDGS